MPEDFDMGMFERLCLELRAFDTHTLVLCGDGEPLLHPRLLDMIRMAKSSRFRTVLLTNGTLINEAKARALVESGIDEIRISFWAATQEDFAKAFSDAAAEHFSDAVDGLKQLVAAKRASESSGPRIGLHLILSRYAARNLGLFADFALESGCDFVSLSPLHTLFGQVSFLGLSRQEESTLKVRLNYVRKRFRAAGMVHNIDETIRRYDIGEAARQRVPCYSGWMQCRVKTDGTVQPCNPCRWPMGSLREQSLREIWTSAAYGDFREKSLLPAAEAEMDARCDCSYCCFVGDHLRVHQVYKWMRLLSPVFGRQANGKE
jgi:MoaA/NifB/PqqE/SkfB family radical SAM enzyme